MSMEDILKVLIDSRQQGNASQQQGADPMASLVGSLLGGGQPQGSSGQQTADLGQMMGVLESVMGGQSGGNDPIMALLSPFIAPLAKKANISPEIATIVVSFLVHKLLAHHPTSGRDSNSFNLDDMLQQMSTGNVDTSLLRSSGMIRELSKKTGLDENATEAALQAAIPLIGKSVSKLLDKKSVASAKPSAAGLKVKATAGSKPTAKKK